MALKRGDKIEYAREDGGGLIQWAERPDGSVSFTWREDEPHIVKGWTFKPTYAHLAGRKPDPAERIVVGEDIPVEVCERLVEEGICKVVDDAPPPPGRAEGASETTPSDPVDMASTATTPAAPVKTKAEKAAA